jgi:hypothetical protein
VTSVRAVHREGLYVAPVVRECSHDDVQTDLSWSSSARKKRKSTGLQVAKANPNPNLVSANMTFLTQDCTNTTYPSA